MATLVGEVGGDDHLRHTWWGEIKGDVRRYNIGRGASGG